MEQQHHYHQQPQTNEPQQHQLNSYFNNHNNNNAAQQQQPAVTAAVASPTNGVVTVADGAHGLFQQSSSLGGGVSLEPAKRRRGRPRKYETPEQALAAKKAATSSRDKTGFHAVGVRGSGSLKKQPQMLGLGNSGQAFTPHIINVAQGEDVGQKIMMFMQQNKREICILSASGAISAASLRQPATSGGSMTYEGRYEIITLSGSYIRTEMGGRAGGLSVCLASANGLLIGGSVGGPLKAAGPVEVIVGTFQIDTKKNAAGGMKGDGPVSTPIGGMPGSSGGFRSPVESSGGSHYMSSMHVNPPRPAEWSGMDARSTGSYDMTGNNYFRSGTQVMDMHTDRSSNSISFAGRAGLGAHHSPENGEYDHIAD